MRYPNSSSGSDIVGSPGCLEKVYKGKEASLKYGYIVIQNSKVNNV
jgi:hypothetical protein